jgi:hypothetical protein
MIRLLLLLFTIAVAACGADPNVTPTEERSAEPVAAPAANWPITDYTVFNTGVDYGHFIDIPGNTQNCWPIIAMFHNAHLGNPTWPNGHPKEGGSISTLGPGNTPETTFLDPRLGVHFETEDAYVYGAANCAPWTNFEQAWNPGWQLRDGLTVFQANDGTGVVTKSKWLWQADAFCYLSGWGSLSHAGESARVERVPVNGAINGHQWRLRLTGSSWTSASAQCVYLGRNYEWLPMRSATQQFPNTWMQIGPDDGMCVISSVVGNNDNGTIIMGVANNQYGIPLYRLSIGGSVTSAQGYCVRWWAPGSVQHPLREEATD